MKDLGLKMTAVAGVLLLFLVSSYQQQQVVYAAVQTDQSNKYLSYLPSEEEIRYLSTASENELMRAQLQANNDNLECTQAHIGNATAFSSCIVPAMNAIYTSYYLAISMNDTQMGMTNELTRLSYLYGWCTQEQQSVAGCHQIFVLFTAVDRLLNP